MADALISVVLEQLASYVQSEVTLVGNTRQEALNLTDTLTQVKAVLADADEKQVKNNAVRLWLDNLKQVVYDADDLLDEWHTRVAISQIQSDVNVTAGTRKKVLSYFLSPCFSFKRVIVRYDIGHQIKDINMRLDVIAKKRTDFGLQVVHQNRDEPQRRLTSSVVDVSKIHGRDQAKEDIMSRLLGETSSRGEALRVIAIVGIGGLGKTTLAKLIFNEERVVEVFKTKIWVCVSDPFSLVGVAKAIIKEATSEDVQGSAEWEEVHKALCQSVKGKQLLLVLDDVWTEDRSHWDPLKLALDGGAPGSRIIVTTRNRSVARIMGSTDSDIHDLEKLSDEDSWSLLRDVALVGREKELEKFEKMGREIAIKCKGVPLAITTLAGVLCERETKKEWKDVLRSDLWEMPQIEQFFLPSLFLSYYSLSSISKQCFLYCGIFRKDEKLKKGNLIRLWMAQGFFGFEERRDLERIGESHFRILAMRSFFQDFEKDSEGNITSCKMHDLVHDFSLHLSQNESSTLLDGDSTVFNCDKIRHLHVRGLQIPYIWNAKNLRTLFFRYKSTVPVELFDNLTCLRTLDLRYCVLGVLPDEVEKLVHLRCLDLSHNRQLFWLPKTICNLYNLQVLVLNGCGYLKRLPEEIGKLPNLRHLEIEGTDHLSFFPKSIAALSSLRTLSEFIVSGGYDECKIGDLQLLNNLQGALKVSWLGVADENDAIRAELDNKINLRELSFCFKKESSVSIGMKNVLEKLEPHEDLEILEISGYSHSHFPGWVQSCSLLTNVVEMRLYKCNGCGELPAFGRLPWLKTLVIREIGSVRHIGDEFYGFDAHQMTAFPKLVSLEMEEFFELKEWDIPILKNRKIMPLLLKLELRNFPKLRALPCVWRMRESLEELTLQFLSSLERVGGEFGNEGSLQQDGVTFPKLKKLTISSMSKLVEWSVPLIAPSLEELYLYGFPKLKTLPTFKECMKTLQFLKIHRMPSWEGQEKLVIISDKEASSSSQGGGVGSCGLRYLKLKMLPTFQGCMKTLKFLQIGRMPSWEGQEKLVIISDKEASSSSSSQGGGVGSCGLRVLDIQNCPKLRVVPDYMFSPSLKQLVLQNDLGDLYNSFPTDDTLCSITQVSLSWLPHSSLPNGFHQLKSLQSLKFSYCKTLDFDLKEGLGHFTMLQQLEIERCPHLEERFKGDDWRIILAHVPKITIDNKEITKH